MLAKVRSGRGAPGDFFLPLPSRPSLCGPLIEMRCGGCWLSRAELKEWSEEERNKKERNAAVAVVVPSSSSEQGSPCLFSFFAPLASPCPLSALVRALVLDLIVKESSSDNDASPRSKERGFSSSRARESAREREGLGRSFFSFLFRFSRPLFTFRPSLGGSLAVVSNELCLLLLFFSFLPAHFSLFHLIKTRIVTFFYHRRNERRERERERTGERRKRGAFFLHFFFFLWLMPSALTSLSRRPTLSR